MNGFLKNPVGFKSAVGGKVAYDPTPRGGVVTCDDAKAVHTRIKRSNADDPRTAGRTTSSQVTGVHTRQGCEPCGAIPPEWSNGPTDRTLQHRPVERR